MSSDLNKIERLDAYFEEGGDSQAAGDRTEDFSHIKSHVWFLYPWPGCAVRKSSTQKEFEE
jgi:hypothetical protein